MTPNHEKKRWLLCESMFTPIEIRASILRKLIREVFRMNPKHQYHLSQRGERVYDAQSWNEMRLLYESTFILIEKRTLILKLATREVSLMNPKNQYRQSHRGECVSDAESRRERRLSCESMFIPIEIRTSILKLVIRGVFITKPKH